MKSKLFVLFLALTLGMVAKADPPVDEGKKIFTARCASCHNVNKVLTGPALADIDKRRSIEWIVSFVKSSQTLVKNGDKDAVALFEKFNKIPMPDHPDLTDDNIKSIVDYIKAESQAGEEKAPFVAPAKLRPAYTPLSIQNDYAYLIGFLALVGLMIFSLLFFVNVMELKRKTSAEE